jgi:hypothetical protein
MVMDVSPASISAQQQAQVQASAGTLVLRKSLDIQAQQASDLLRLMDTQNGLGQNLNVTA